VEHKKQHWVPQSYLTAWCDPDVPDGQEPYVWCFPREGGPGKRKAPKNLFAETDMYTITRDDGSRDLYLERGLASLESDFAAVRRETLAACSEPSPDERFILCAIIAAAHARTRVHRDHTSNEWGKALSLMERMSEAYDAASPEQREEITSAFIEPANDRPALTEQDVRRLVTAPLQETFIATFREQMRFLPKMQLAILRTTAEPGFITSDVPCVWWDPEARNRPFPYDSVGLLFPTLEITLPISPEQMATITHAPIARGGSVYFELTGPYEVLVDELNRRTRAHCDEHFVVARNETHPVWYDLGRRLEPTA
jgi:hypothetical protein